MKRTLAIALAWGLATTPALVTTSALATTPAPRWSTLVLEPGFIALSPALTVRLAGREPAPASVVLGAAGAYRSSTFFEGSSGWGSIWRWRVLPSSSSKETGGASGT